jgi:hypothetical protein
MKTFKEFPKDDKCILCGTNENKECILIPIDGTKPEGEHYEQVTPAHLDCIQPRYNREAGEFGIIYQRCVVAKEIKLD